MGPSLAPGTEPVKNWLDGCDRLAEAGTAPATGHYDRPRGGAGARRDRANDRRRGTPRPSPYLVSRTAWMTSLPMSFSNWG